MTTPRKKTTVLTNETTTPDSHAIQTAVEAAMRALPKIRWEVENNIPLIAEKYVQLCFDYFHAAHTQRISKTETERHLTKIKDQCAALLMTLRTMQAPVAEALNSHRPEISDPVLGCMKRPPTLGQMQSYLQWLNEAATLAKAPSTVKVHKGPDRLLNERAIASAAAIDFFRLTRKQPTRGANKGGFPDFLREIFAALNVKNCSIDDRAREVAEQWRGSRTERCRSLGK